MNDLFGLSMTYIMIALLVILSIAAATVAWVVARNRVMFFIGVRNIPRRRAQTVLIVIGLMLSTLIISTAFSIGDTVDYSMSSQIYERMHSVDEVVQATVGEGEDNPFINASLTAPRAIPQDRALDLITTIRQTDGVDGAVPVLMAPVPVTDVQAGLTEPIVLLMGLDAELMGGFETDIETADGAQAPIRDLRPGEIYANESLADALDIKPGNTLRVFVAQAPHEFTVRAIVKDRVLSGAALGLTKGVVLNLRDAQQLAGRPDQADFIAVSNDGGVRTGIETSGAVTALINRQLVNTPWLAAETKQDLVDLANQTSSFLVTFFVVLGLFSIAAGMLLVFLIFVMLSAERKTELGMIRAVGTKRSHLIQIFMSEGMAYNTLAAAVGCALGVAVSLFMVRILASLFASEDISIAFHVSPRSLTISYSLGVVLTFLTVTFSSWRIGNLNIVSAIRDAPDPPPPDTRPRSRTGVMGTLWLIRWLLVKPIGLRAWLTGLGIMLTVPLQAGITFGLFLGATALYGNTAVASVLAVLLGVAGVLTAATSVVTAGFGLNRVFQSGALALVIGSVLVFVGLAAHQAAPYALGVSLVVLGVGLTLVMLRFQQRLIFSVMGLTLLGYWLLSAGGKLPPNLDGGIELFFLSGVTMVVAATFVLVYNADVMLGLLTRFGDRFSTLIPSIRTAVAYPIANKFRTGMTVAMISLVMFALVMMSTMNSNFSRIFLSEDALGGYDVAVTENPANPIADLSAELERQGADTGAIAAVGDLRLANARAAEVRNQPQPGAAAEDFAQYPIIGPTAAFIADNGIKFQARAEGLASDADVWRMLASNPNAAVIDAFVVGGGDGGPDGGGFSLKGITGKDRTFKPVHLEVRDAADPANVRAVEIVGVFKMSASLIYNGLYLSPRTFDAVFRQPESTNHFLKLQDGVDPAREAKNIERALQSQGAQADSLRELIDEQRRLNQNFLYLIQGFMGIGLFVGIAAVGVIAFRTVVERRQQIGMLRAIGYTRQAIAVSFIMESSFITLLGVLSGITLGLMLAYQLTHSDDFAPGGVAGFYIPWLQIIGIGLFAFIASLIMTIIPSRRASGMAIAEALRYE